MQEGRLSPLGSRSEYPQCLLHCSDTATKLSHRVLYLLEMSPVFYFIYFLLGIDHVYQMSVGITVVWGRHLIIQGVGFEPFALVIWIETISIFKGT